MSAKKTQSEDIHSTQQDEIKNEKNWYILIRYFGIAIFLGGFAIAIFATAIKIGVVEKKEWLKLEKDLKRTSRLINPARGTIFSNDDRIMATNFPQYHLYMDFKSSAILLDSLQGTGRNGVDSLSYFLSKKLKNRTQAGYKTHILQGVKSKKTDYPLFVGPGISYKDLKEIKTYPFLRLGIYRNGLHEKERMYRRKPFGNLASRTVGDIYTEIDEKTGLTQGKNGLELQYDSLLCGIPGRGREQRVGGRWAVVVEVDPVDGMDIRSTIDISIQDLVEKALVDKLKELNAADGIAMVMEVKTGEIKAITNMARIRPGQYGETLNHAVADVIEPGSTFKVAAMMVALDDGVVNPKTPVDVGKGVYKYGNRTMLDHNSNRGGYGMINAEKAIWYSSNIGMAKMILKGYENNPKKFIDGLRRIGMDADLKLEIPGAGKPRLRQPDDKLWSRYSLPWMSFGYEVQIPPIQTLAFFNAIANNGTMVRPMFVKDILKNGKSVKHFNPEVIIPQICTPQTLKVIQDMLYNVVNYVDPTPSNRNGTGRPAQSDVITIAGKTGTAQIASGGGYGSGGHRVTFCGYFPYENPEYTCIVVITRPQNGIVSGGSMCGTVVKDIAEKIYSHCTVLDIKTASADSGKTLYPNVKNGDYTASKNVTKGLRIKTNDANNIKSDYVVATEDDKGVTMKPLQTGTNLVPNVVGMGAKDAVFALENCNLRVTVTGYGSVVSQSVANGSKVVPGQLVTLTLK